MAAKILHLAKRKLGSTHKSSHQNPPGGIASGRPRTARPEGSPPVWLSSVQAAKAISPSDPEVVAAEAACLS